MDGFVPEIIILGSVILFIAMVMISLNLGKSRSKMYRFAKVATTSITLLMALYILSISTKELTTTSFCIAIGIGFSILGDWFLKNRPSNIDFGMAASMFMMTHIFYIHAFVFAPEFYMSMSGKIVSVIACCIIMLFVIITAKKKVKGIFGILLSIYSFFLTIMVVLSFSTGLPHFIAAGILFFISDSLLACNKFIKPVKKRWESVLGTYYLSQFIFATGLFIVL